MKSAQYVPLVGTTPKVVTLDTNVVMFQVQIRLPAGATALGCLENPNDSIAPNGYTPPVTTQAPVWLALPAAVNGIISLNMPYAAIQITPTADGIATVLQQGLI